MASCCWAWGAMSATLNAGAADPKYLLHFVHVLLVVLLHQVVPASAQDDFVVHVCYVHHEKNVVPKVVLQHPAQDVKGQVVACMPKVCTVIHSWPARVPSDLLAVRACRRNEGDLFVQQAVVQHELSLLFPRLWWEPFSCDLRHVLPLLLPGIEPSTLDLCCCCRTDEMNQAKGAVRPGSTTA